METGTRATLSHRFNLLALLLLTPLLGCVEPPAEGRGTPAWTGEDEDAEGEPAELPPEDLPESRIYGGAPVGACGWPTTVSLGGSCTGTLVHPQVVLYAAHCGDDYSSIRFGEKVSGGGGRNVATSFCEVYP